MKDYLVAGLLCGLKGLAILAIGAASLAVVFGVMYLIELYGLKWLLGSAVIVFLLFGFALGYYTCVEETVQRKRATGRWW
jgi:hypothetical protein